MNENDHHHRRVWWDGQKGGAYFDDVEIYSFRRPPKVTGVRRLVELEYAPRRGVFYVRTYGAKQVRDMTDDEKLDVEARFAKMFNGAHDAWA